MQLFLYWLLILYSFLSINTSVYNISLCFFLFSLHNLLLFRLYKSNKTLLFGCANQKSPFIFKNQNPTFRLCKPYFSVVQTLLFGCANPTFRLCNENRIAQPRAFSRFKNRPYIYLYIILLREE